MRNQGKFVGLGCAGLGAVGIVAALALVVGLIGYQYTRYQAVAERLPENAVPLTVVILDPGPGHTSIAGVPVVVTAHGAGAEPLLSLELWANGVEVEAQAAPSGVNEFEANFTWTPLQPGNYSLSARVRDSKQRTADSASVLALVYATQKLSDPSKDDHPTQAPPGEVSGGPTGVPRTVMPTPLPLPTPPVAPNLADPSVGPAQPWQPSLGGLVSQLSVSEAPAAPELAGVAEGCGASLSFHDLSNNEDGFFVYRQSPSLPQWTRIATLNSQSAQMWLKYADGGAAGLRSYYVAAFNNQGEAASNIVAVDVDPAQCVGQTPASPQVLSVGLTDLKTNLAVDEAYCYRSLGGLTWSRWPATGFFMPTGAARIDFPQQGESFLLTGFDDKALKLDLECWGWAGGQLQMLGKFHTDSFKNPGGLHLEDGGASIDLKLDLGVFPSIGNNPYPSPPPPPTPTPTPVPPLPANWHIPAPNPKGSLNVGDCINHLPGTTKPDFELGDCHPGDSVSTTNPVNLDDHPHGYLLWTLDKPNPNNCVAPCINPFDPNQKGKFGFNIYDMEQSDAVPLASYYGLAQTVYPLPFAGPACGTSRLLSVRLYWIPQGSQQMQESAGFNAIVQQPCPKPGPQKIDVTFKTFTLGNVSDGGGDNLELYGGFMALSTSNNGGVLKLGSWGNFPDGCPDDEFHATFNTNGIPFDCPAQLTAGSYSMSDFGLCFAHDFGTCAGPFGTNNTTLHLTVKDGDAIIVQVILIDHDDLSADDPACNGIVNTGPRPIETWAGLKNGEAWSVSQGDNGNASCKVDWTLTTVTK